MPKAAGGIFLVILAFAVKTTLDSSSPSSVSRTTKVPRPENYTINTEVRNDEDDWPWTEETQPNVREVFERAANLTEVNGRKINVSVLHKDPMIIQIDNFLTDDQCELMISLAIEQGLERSTTTGKMEGGKFHRPVDDSRTSSNSWCFNTCFRNPIVNEVDKMIEWIAARPKKHMEHYQLLHYEVGQQYKEHHDFILDQAKMSQGPRQFTFFLYLNDVEAGGETHFPRLDLKVKPKKGRAIMWPNVYFDQKSENNQRLHPKTFHAALPVIKGEKYGANKWIHKGDFLTPWENGVSG